MNTIKFQTCRKPNSLKFNCDFSQNLNDKKTSAVAKELFYNKYKYTAKTENEFNVFTFKD